MKIKNDTNNLNGVLNNKKTALENLQAETKENREVLEDKVSINVSKDIANLFSDVERQNRVAELKALHQKGELKAESSDKLSKAIGNIISEEIRYEQLG